MNTEEYAKDLFYVNRRFLRYGGLWPSDKETTLQSKLYRIYQILVYTIVTISGTISVMLAIIENLRQHDIQILIELLNMGLTLMMAGFKSTFWLISGQNVKVIMNDLENKEFYYESIDDFHPGILMKKAKSRGENYSLFLFATAILTLGFAYIPAIVLSSWYYIKDVPITNVTMFEKLPYHTYVPINYHETPLKYLVGCLLQATPCYFCVPCFVGVDTIFMCSLNFIGAHMLILQGAFKTLKKRCLQRIHGPSLTSDGLYNSNELEEHMMIEIKKSIRHLQMLMRVCIELEDNYKFVSLCQALCSLYILCSSLLMLSTVDEIDKQFGNEIFYFVGIHFQLGLYFWFGNEISLKGMDLTRALWESDWLESRRPFKTCLFITMNRMKKPVYLTVGKFAPLLLNTYISVLKGSYSFYTVLKSTGK